MNYKIKVEYQVEDKIKNLSYIINANSLSEAESMVRDEVNRRFSSQNGTIVSVTLDM